MNTTLFRKVALALILGTTLAFGANAQILRTSYFMNGNPERMKINPALAPSRGYVLFPVIGGIDASLASNSLGFGDVTDIINNSSEDNYFLSDDFYNRLADKTKANAVAGFDLISAGWWHGKNFWSFNLSTHANINMQMPRSMFGFMREMQGVQENFNAIDWRHYDRQFGDEQLRVTFYSEVGVGYARQLTKRLNIGGRVKLLIGHGDIKLNVDNMDIKTDLRNVPDNVDWGNLTPEQINSIQGTADIRTKATLETSLDGFELMENEQGYIDDVDFSFKGGVSGYGAAVDLGASYQILDNLTVSAAITDLGFIAWQKGATTAAVAAAEQHFDSRNPDDVQQFADLVSSGEVMNFDMLELRKDEEAANSRTTTPGTTLTFGGEYGFLENKLRVGALSTTRFNKPYTQSELTLSANYSPSSFLDFAFSYSPVLSGGKAFGLGLKLGPLFLGTDYMFFGNSSRTFNAHFGIIIPLGKKSI